MPTSFFNPQTDPPRPARIGAFLPLDAGYGRDVLRGIARFYREQPAAEVLKFNQRTHYDFKKLRELQLDGIIAKVVNARDEARFCALGIPVINFSGQCSTKRIPIVTSDDQRAGEMAFGHFAQRGFRHFAYCGTANHQGSRHRLEAYQASAAKRFPDSTVDTLFVPDGDQDGPFSEHTRHELAAWLEALPKPIGVFTFTDRLALEIDEASRRARINVPGEVGILGVGNDQTRIAFAHVPLSSIELATEQNGYVAAELLEKWRLHGERPPDRTTIRPRCLITRASTDVLAVSDECVAVALDYIYENLGNRIQVDAVARTAGVSRRTLEQRFRSHLNESVYGIVQKLKFELAIELLSQPDIRIGDIANRIGLPETKAFSRAFQQRYGQSPSQFRQSKQI